MRRLPALLLLALLLAATLAGGSPAGPAGGQAPPAPPPPGEVLLVLGDSLAVGVGATSPVQRGFAAVLQGWLTRLPPARPIVLTNLGVAGETSASFIEGGQLARARAELEAAARDGRRVSPVVLSIGGNDLLAVERAEAAARRQALARFEGNLARILDDLDAGLTRADGRTGALVLLTVYNPHGGAAGVAGSDAWWVEQFNGVLRAAAAARGLTLVDAWALVAGHEAAWTHIGVGDVHPTNAGHAAIAGAIWRALGYDAVAPAVELVTPVPGALSRPVPTVRARASDAVGVTRVELWADGRRVKELTWLPDYGLYVATWDGRTAAAGAHRLEVRAFDEAGNAGQAAVEVQLK